MSPRIIVAGAVALAIAGSLSACGKLGQLEPPGPLNANRAQQGQPPEYPVTTVDHREDPTMDPAPPRTLPIEGQGQDPTASGPQGVLPDPFANPRQ